MPTTYNGNLASIVARQNVSIQKALQGDPADPPSVFTAIEKLADLVQYLQQKAGLLDTASAWTSIQTFIKGTAIAPRDWTSVGSLLNSWVTPSPNASDQGAAMYRVQPDGLVKFRGAISGGVSGSSFVTMPVGLRPEAVIQCPLVSSNVGASTGQATVFTNGNIHIAGTNTNTTGYVSLGGLSFYAFQ